MIKVNYLTSQKYNSSFLRIKIIGVLMLIACQPKSASSAFARGLSDLMGIYTIQRQLEPHKSYVLNVLKGGRGAPPPKSVVCHPEYPTLSRIHPDTNDLPERLIMRFLLSETTLYKQAIIPVDRHIHIIKKYLPYSKGMIILLRNPEDTVNAYKKHYSHGNGLYDIDPAYYEPAYKEHKKFVCSYIAAFDNNPRVKFVCYERLLLHTASVMKECVNFFKCNSDVPSDYQLPKRRFTGQGVERLFGNKKLFSFFSCEDKGLDAQSFLEAYQLTNFYSCDENRNSN